MKQKRYRIMLARTIRQTTEVICAGSNPSAAVHQACAYAWTGLTWHDGAVLVGPSPADRAYVIEEPVAPPDAKETL